MCDGSIETRPGHLAQYRAPDPLFGLVYGQLATDSRYIVHDISDEEYRVYETLLGDGEVATLTIHEPRVLVIREGGQFHRIVNADGETFLAPNPSVNPRTSLRWFAPERPVAF